MSRSPADISKTVGRGAEYHLKAAFIRRIFRELSRLGEDQRQVLQYRVHISFFRNADVELLRAKSDARAHLPEAPRQECAAVDGVLEPLLEVRRNIAIQEDLDGAFLLPRELPNLQVACMRRGLPIEMPRALESFV